MTYLEFIFTVLILCFKFLQIDNVEEILWFVRLLKDCIEICTRRRKYLSYFPRAIGPKLLWVKSPQKKILIPNKFAYCSDISQIINFVFSSLFIFKSNHETSTRKTVSYQINDCSSDSKWFFYSRDNIYPLSLVLRFHLNLKVRRTKRFY